MGLTVSKPEGGDFELAPSATHIARCYMVVDEGVQKTKFGDKHMIRIGWELSNELMSDGRPFVVSKEYNANLHSDSNLTKDLTSWRGRAFTDEELSGFDLFKIAGAPCMITIIHNPSGDRVFANVSSVTSTPKGTPVPNLTNEKIIFSLEEPDQVAFQKIPEWIRKKISYGSASPQHGQSNQLANQHPLTQSSQQLTYSNDAFDDDIPF